MNIWKRRFKVAALVAVASVSLVACANDTGTTDSTGSDSSSAAAMGPVRISGQSWSEAALMASMYEQVLADMGFQPEVKLVDTRDVYMQTFPGEVDVVPEYVGGVVDFLNTTVNGADAPSLTTSDAADSLANASTLFADKGITMLAPSEATDTNAFFVSQKYSDENGGLTKLSQLKGKKVVLAAAPDCEGRADCSGGLSGDYGIKVTDILPLGFASDATYQAVIDGEAQLGLTSTTDGTLASQGLVLLEDDLKIQPAQNLVPAVSSAFLTAHPDVQPRLEALMAALTTEKLTELNGRISVDRELPETVAKDFLVSEGLIG